MGIRHTASNKAQSVAEGNFTVHSTGILPTVLAYVNALVERLFIERGLGFSLIERE